MAAALVSALLVVGCSDSDSDSGGGGGGGNDYSWDNVGLVLPSGYAWTDAHEFEVGNRDGIIFHSDGTVQLIVDYDGIWIVDVSGRYTVSGNTITGTIEGESMSTTYSIVGNKLTMPGIGMEFVITSNVTIGASSNNSTVFEIDGSGDNGGDNGGNNDHPPLTGGNLENGANDAWVMCNEDGSCEGYMFYDNTVYSVFGSDDIWFRTVWGPYTTSGNTITVVDIDFDGIPETVTILYGVSGNQLALDLEDGVEVYTKQTGLDFYYTLENPEDFLTLMMCAMFVEMEMFDSIEECMDNPPDEDEWDTIMMCAMFVEMEMFDSIEECMENDDYDGDWMFKQQRPEGIDNRVESLRNSISRITNLQPRAVKPLQKRVK